MIPRELQAIPRWVIASPDKVPIQPTGEFASTRSPDTWSDYDTVVNVIRGCEEYYPGFVFSGDGLIGIDIDTGLDEAGFFNPMTVNIVRECRSYTEASKSGRGIHIILRGTLPFAGRNNGCGVEIYSTGRYFVMTGKTLAYADTIRENQEAINKILSEYFIESVPKERKETVSRKRIYSTTYHTVGHKLKLIPMYPEIPQGARHISMVSYCGQLANMDLTPREIRDELMLANENACKPPLPEREIEQIVRSILKYER